MSETATPYGELVARDPLTLTRTDIDAIIAHLRANRQRFLQGGTTPAAPKKSTAAAKLATNLGSEVTDLLGGLDL